ncbi:leucyl aminopeptidase [Rhodoblastus acidophilus]|uniref:leucyl aminopeptidase family protein n=1 Tax=Rhodoblastus acidophilus TaxID=1074 RepID=UPI0022245201|nr:leucyl aminopeptidase family protein [Rhodoblastus acidophilus]MCW2284679.1 leucyl aminopeptidase [Rhodoblastus acidophilus]MCW2333632.1 leucyl aminopeptidase [Rhodoblastus acidophilus]
MPELPELTFAGDDATATPVWIAPAATIKAALAGEGGDLPAEAVALARASGFEPRAGKHLFFVQASGAAGVLFCLDEDGEPFQLGALSGLPEGVYRLVGSLDKAALAALGFLLGSYRFSRYKSAKPGPRLVAPEGVLRAEVEAEASAVALARDLVNTPANDLGPDELESFARAVAEKFGAAINVVKGEALERDFPLIYAVGKGSPRAPRLVELRWKPERAQKLALVGKGVCFDSGGLDIKPESAMGLMKKDMGGAAAALAASAMIMAANLDVSLRLLLPIVENSVSGEAFRPGDIYPSRKGLTVEIGNTDAEGRLILADALALADEDKPDLLVDFATLTGAARVALGPDLPPFYTEDEALAEAIARHGAQSNDPVWRLPLWKAYESKLDGKIADLNNAPAGGMAGSIMAALFLKRFVSPGVSWAHFDIYAWNPAARPGRPEGGEAQAARLIYSLAREKFGLAKLS